MQQGQRHSELFNPHREPVSGFLVYPPHKHPDVKETESNFSGRIYNRPSHSGPLVQGPGWAKGRKEADEGPFGSNRVSLSKLSGLVASRTLASEDQEEKPVPSQSRKIIEGRRSVEASNGSESRRQDRKRQTQRLSDLYHVENGRPPPKESTPVSFLLSSLSLMYVFLLQFGVLWK